MMTSAEDIRNWLVARLAELLDMSAAEVAEASTLEELGADSFTIARLTEDLREATGAVLPPTLMYDVQGFDALVAAVVAALPSRTAAPARRRIALAASFTAEPLEEPLGYLLDTAGLSADLAFAPYNQIFQQLLDPDAAFGRDRAAARLVLLRLEDWFRYAASPLSPDSAGQVIGQLCDALTAARARLDGLLMVVLCPHAPQDAERLENPDRRLLAALEAVVGVDLLDLRTQAEGHSDAARDRLGHIPYTPTGYAALALALGRRLHRHLRPPAKVVVTDCDNTLWAGVVGEDGPAGVRITPGHRALQEFLLERQRAGLLLAVASKNLDRDVWTVFDSHPDMRLRRDDIAAARIDWTPKPDNLRALARELALGLDSIIFLDDSPAECAAMTAALPEVTVVQLPPDAADFAAILAAHWAFDSAPATAEDRRRTDMYREARQRRQLEAGSAGFDDFLAALAIAIDIRPLTEDDVPRAAQLTQRTNQFNTTTIRRDEPDLRRLVGAAPPQALTVRVRDRFGDYGLVGLAVLRWSAEACEVDGLMLSCRVLGRRVEHAMMRHLAVLAAGAGVARLVIPVRSSERNQPARWFLERLGDGLTETSIVLVPDAIETALARTRDLRVEVPAEDAAGIESSAVAEASSDGLAQIARLAGNPAALARALADRVAARPDLDQPFLAPRTPLQGEIARIWREVLHLDRVGLNDDFYALGGDSLAGAEVLARLQALGLPEHLGLAIISQPTVGGLAQAIEDVRDGRPPRLVAALASLESEAELPADIRRLCAAAGPWRPVAAQRYFLTGATGYVGAYLAAELLRRPGISLVCLVRARDNTDGWRRLRGNLEGYELWRPDFAERITVVVGALDSPRLGLPDPQYNRLAREVDAVIHNGACVNFIFPFSHLRRSNVDGTVEALRFAAHGRVKPLHFVSTLGVLMSGYTRGRVIREDEELDRSEDLPNGYEQTKWVADKMVWHAMRAGYPAAIHRLGMLSGLAACGTYHKLSEFLPSFLKGCVQLGSFPHLDSKIEMVPVDVITRALARIVEQPEAIGKVFHMNHPAALFDEAFVDCIRDYGYPLRFLPWDVWKRDLVGSGARLRDNALYPFLDFIRGLQAYQTHIPEMDMTNFFALAGAEAASCPDQPVLIRRYFDHFVRVGYLPPPALARAAE